VPRSQPLRIDLRKGAKSAVPLADRAIGNLQQWLIGTYHGVSRDQLQFYLDEFVFRHNRRRQPMAAFQTLLGLGTGRAPTPYELIRCHAVCHAVAGLGSEFSLAPGSIGGHLGILRLDSRIRTSNGLFDAALGAGISKDGSVEPKA
jgi:hypothetical protein